MRWRNVVSDAEQTFNAEALLELIKTLIRLDANWIPDKPGYSLYIRPTLSESHYRSHVSLTWVKSERSAQLVLVLQTRHYYS